MTGLIDWSREFIATHGLLGIFSLTTLEQFIFPVPADLFIAMGTGSGLPMGKVLFVVLIAALLGSFIGYFLGRALGHPAAVWLFKQRHVDRAEQFINKWGVWGVIIAGLTPIPFKLITWCAGIFEMPVRKFFLGVIIGRMPRYILAAYAAEKFMSSKFYASTDMSAIILGGLQGLTEFLPVSSSGHLVIMEHFLQVPMPAEQLITFDIFLHGGSLIAIVAYFWKDWLQVLREIWQMLISFRLKTDTLAFRLAAATIPAIIAGLTMGNQISNSLRSLHSVAIFFILVGLLYFYAAWKGKKNHEETVTLKKAIIIGLAQAVALIPGVSRAGSTIATGVILGIRREAAARFSFMLGGIAILAANVYALLSLGEATMPEAKFILLGAGSAFITSIIAIYLLLRFLQKYTMRSFGLYLILVGSLILSFL